MISRKLVSIAAIAAVAATAVYAGGHGGNPAVKARQAHMQLYAFNLGILGGMVQEKTEYNAEMATTAAADLAALAALTQANYWPEGTSSEDLPEESRALPNGWTDFQGAIAISMKLAENSAAMAAVAGNGLDELKAAFGPAAGTCGECHKAYRAPNN